MIKEIISSRQAINIIIMFLIGSSIITGVNSEAEQDTWISIILSVIYIMPIIVIYSRIIKLYPEQDLFDIINILFGKFIGKTITILFSWYSLHLGALVLRNFSEFIEIVAMPETPQIPIMLIMLVVTIYMAKSGIEPLGKWNVFVFPIVFGVVILTIIFSIRQMDFSYIKPIFSHKLSKISYTSYQIFTFPLAESVVFLALAGSFKKSESPYKIYVYGVLIGSIVLLLAILRNIGVLGTTLLKQTYFPSYTVARIINISDFFPRIEGTISINFIFTGITKITVCLIAASKGFASFFNITNYKNIIFPVSMIMLALCAIVYENTMQMFDFLKIYSIYAIPFQILIPIIIWIAAEINHKKNKGHKSYV